MNLEISFMPVITYYNKAIDFVSFFIKNVRGGLGGGAKGALPPSRILPHPAAPI